MDNEVTEVRVSVEATAIFHRFSVKMTTTHKKKILYRVSEFYPKSGWKELPYSASNYIVEDFKKTPEHNEVLDIMKVAISKHGY